jgi:hypothetical protein
MVNYVKLPANWKPPDLEEGDSLPLWWTLSSTTIGKTANPRPLRSKSQSHCPGRKINYKEMKRCLTKH